MYNKQLIQLLRVKLIVVFVAGRAPAPLPPRRDPKTTLSVGRARAKSMVSGMGGEHAVFCVL